MTDNSDTLREAIETLAAHLAAKCPDENSIIGHIHHTQIGDPCRYLILQDETCAQFVGRGEMADHLHGAPHGGLWTGPHEGKPRPWDESEALEWGDRIDKGAVLDWLNRRSEGARIPGGRGPEASAEHNPEAYDYMPDLYSDLTPKHDWTRYAPETETDDTLHPLSLDDARDLIFLEAVGAARHLNRGQCPEPGFTLDRDPQCRVCQALRVVESAGGGEAARPQVGYRSYAGMDWGDIAAVDAPVLFCHCGNPSECQYEGKVYHESMGASPDLSDSTDSPSPRPEDARSRGLAPEISRQAEDAGLTDAMGWRVAVRLLGQMYDTEDADALAIELAGLIEHAIMDTREAGRSAWPFLNALVSRMESAGWTDPEN